MSTFDAFAHDYSAQADARGPAFLDLLGDVEGLRVLDAGCGPGIHLAALIARGARGVGIDESEAFVAIARERVGEDRVLLGDLDAQLAGMDDASFDRALLSGVLHHLASPARTLGELRRVLTAGGRLVVTTHHPTADWLRFGGDYFAVARESVAWGNNGDISVRRAPLEVLSREFADAGFLIERIVEPHDASGSHGAESHGAESHAAANDNAESHDAGHGGHGRSEHGEIAGVAPEAIAFVLVASGR